MPRKRSFGSLHHENLYENDKINPQQYITCQQPPCANESIPIELYPSHVEQYHDHRCESCQKNLVNENFLQLHLEEYHNPFQLGEGIQLRCLESQCPKKFASHSDRIEHLQIVHRYPSNFNFSIIQSGHSFD